MERGDFGRTEGFLSSNSCVLKDPLDLQNWWKEQNDFVFKDMRWIDVAKSFLVQSLLWRDEGWNIPRSDERHVLEECMRRHGYQSLPLLGNDWATQLEDVFGWLATKVLQTVLRREVCCACQIADGRAVKRCKGRPLLYKCNICRIPKYTSPDWSEDAVWASWEEFAESLFFEAASVAAVNDPCNANSQSASVAAVADPCNDTGQSASVAAVADPCNVNG